MASKAVERSINIRVMTLAACSDARMSLWILGRAVSVE